MDPFSAVELWWIAPAVVGAGAAGGSVTLRRRGRRRRLAVDAARKELAEAKTDVVTRHAALRVARADLAHVTAARAAGRATDAEVHRSRRRLRDAEIEARATSALVRSRRARLRAARAELSTPGDPLERLMAGHEAIIARWMRYETDPALLIAYPRMTDVRVPATAALSAARERASLTRPSRDAGRISPEEFAAYRDAVAALDSALNEAERVAGAVTDPRPSWQDAAQSLLGRGAEVLRDATAEWTARRRDDR
ncbi:hypothetical protein [Microbacterium sp. 22242]|uniref:hypothetical protein n=1 Tax=Microbacterium sp. 22242 TaxID=3453896 RepID=UPI003F84BF25